MKRLCYSNKVNALIRKIRIIVGTVYRSEAFIVLEERMSRAVILMKNTTLSNEEIAAMLGYSDQSNFYKAFREFYGVSPREYEITDR